MQDFSEPNFCTIRIDAKAPQDPRKKENVADRLNTVVIQEDC